MPSDDNQGKAMTTKKRLIIGALGGITPYILTLLIVDFASALRDFEFFDGVGLAVRCIVLVFAGALVAYFNKSEPDEFKLFQLGVAAPALLATGINGYSISDQDSTVAAGTTESAAPAPENASFFSSIFASAYAQEAAADNSAQGSGQTSACQMDANAKQASTRADVKNTGCIREPELSNTDRFLRGLVGKKEPNRFSVVAGSFGDLRAAKTAVTKLSKKGYEARVVTPQPWQGIYGVAIGTNLPRDVAIHLRDQAIADGLSADTYIKAQ
jgi:cell division septation protein DedD